MSFLFDSIAAASSLPADRPLHLAIGMFDGVHLGHRAVLEAAVKSARRTRGIAAALTFSPHPSHLFHPENPVRLILSDEAKIHTLRSIGIEAVIMQRFTREFAGIEADAFVPCLHAHLPSLDSIYVGENWRFGRARKGDVSLLIAEARQRKIHVLSAERIKQDGVPISSTRIRAALADARIDEANAMLAAPYTSSGVVRRGKQLGRTIGFPTLNLAWDDALLPPHFGVYAQWVRRADDDDNAQAFPAVSNFGLRPTVENTAAPSLEIHLLSPDCPFETGDSLRIQWMHFLRPEKKFPGIDALREAIAADCEAARAWFHLA